MLVSIFWLGCILSVWYAVIIIKAWISPCMLPDCLWHTMSWVLKCLKLLKKQCTGFSLFNVTYSRMSVIDRDIGLLLSDSDQVEQIAAQPKVFFDFKQNSHCVEFKICLTDTVYYYKRG